jgi:hypothetical protein
MLVDGAGEIIVDALTANRSFASIPSASAILDTSNYTIQAVSFGKDAEGFRNHAHIIYTPSDSQIIKVLSYEPTSILTYHTSATAQYLEDLGYKLYPESPSPIHRKLEIKSTIPNYSSGVPDIGHCLNTAIHPTLSSVHHLVGCFPTSGGTDFWMFSSTTVPSNTITSGTLSSFFNYHGIMDCSGFLKVADGDAAYQLNLSGSGDFTKGAIRVRGTNFPNSIFIVSKLVTGDAGSLLLFGGLYHIGLWVLDLKETLKQGITAPFSFNALNNQRKYKLFAKKTFNKDLLFCQDIGGFSALKEFFAIGGIVSSDGFIQISYQLNFV